MLAIEASLRGAAVGLALAGAVYSAQVDPQLGAAAGLTAAIRRALRSAERRPADVDVLAVNRGPGSFTGLRIALASAKAWCFATGAKLAVADTFEIVAATIPPLDGRLAIAVDAQRGQWLLQWHARGDDGWIKDGPARLLPAEEAVPLIGPLDRIGGPALLGRKEWSGPRDRMLNEAVWKPGVEGLLAVAARRIADDDYSDVFALAPWYARPSAAEEKKRAGDGGR